MTIKEIAGLAGVSISTVSKIVNSKDENINAETRNRVLKIVKEYHYSPYASAKTASTAKTFVLGVLLKSASNSRLLLDGILSAARENGYHILICDSCNSAEEELKNITALCKYKVDGVIWDPVNSQSLQYEHHFAKLDIVSVIYGSSLPDSSYCIDFSALGYKAARILTSYKHRKIACLLSPGSRRSQLILEGFKKCLYDNQIPFAAGMIISADSDSWYSDIAARKYTAILCGDFTSCLSLYEQLYNVHYRIPYDISLIALKDDVPEDLHYPPISGIQVPYYELGRYICQDLIGRCEKRELSVWDIYRECTLDHTASLDIPYGIRSKKIVVVGGINIDITLNVDELPHSGKAVSTSRSTTFPGGKGVNQAIGAARLGHAVSLIGKVGNDYDSALIYSAMKENEVDIQGIGRDLCASTGKAYIHVQNDGESTISILTGANQHVGPQDITDNERLFENAGYCLLPTEIPDAAIEIAAQTAKKYGAVTILKPTLLEQIPDSILKNIDIFIPNRLEMAALCPGISTLSQQADSFIRKGVHTVIITLGHRGCYVKSPDYEHYYPAVGFVSVDNTGAADAFIAALASYLLYGYQLNEAVQIAGYAAGFCISRQGVVPALIDRNSLEAYIKKVEPDLIH